MALSYVVFDLQDGFIMNWLAAGPQVIEVEDLTDSSDNSARQSIARQYYQPKSGIDTTPVERGPLNEGVFKIGAYEGEWSYYRCREDHLVDLSTTQPYPAFMRAWAYTQLTSPADQAVHFVLTTYGPVDVWVNKKSVFHSEQFSAQPAAIPFDAELKSGKNQVLVRFAGVAAPQCTLAVGLWMNAEEVRVQIPTLIPSLERRNELEAVLESVYLDRDVYASDEPIVLTWPEGPDKSAFNDVRLQTRTGRIYGQAEDIGQPGSSRILGTPVTLPEGPMRAFIMPRAWEYYESNIRITKALDCWSMGRNSFSSVPYGTLEERRREALFTAAGREGDLYAEIAKIALGAEVDRNVLAKAIERVHRRQVDSEIDLLGLLGLRMRFGSRTEFAQDLSEDIQAAAQNYRYWKDAPGAGIIPFDAEDRQIVLHTCQILAGQLYPDEIFAASGQSGTQLREQGEALALAWMQARGQNGFADWEAKESYANILLALSHLIDLAESEAVWELSSVLMDKMLFAMALNSYRGVFGSAQRRAQTAGLKSGLLEATSGVSRLLWGMGVFNHHIAATVALACMEKYELPPIIADIAAGLQDALWNREQHAAGQPVNKVTFRTPNYMLCSAQDYHPGQCGESEHIWQATLGPQSLVFVTHPGCSSESDAHVPNFWSGNGILPRVAQWKDTLIALYDLPDDDPMGFTHAYFPTRGFDEYTLRDGTAFARKGDGYLALTASSGLELLQQGRTAFRELRSYGKQTVWLCQMGRAAVDGDFAAFQEKVLAQKVTFTGLAIDLVTLRGESLSFGWDAPLLRNGENQPLSGFPHYENPYTATGLPCQEMEIKTEDYLLRLKFMAELS